MSISGSRPMQTSVRVAVVLLVLPVGLVSLLVAYLGLAERPDTPLPALFGLLSLALVSALAALVAAWVAYGQHGRVVPASLMAVAILETAALALVILVLLAFLNGE